MASIKGTFIIFLLACTFLSTLASPQHDNIPSSLKKKLLNDLIRRKRSPQTFYNPWTPSYLTAIIKIPIQQGLTLWQPQPYDINRPYFIPVLGASGKLPIYFPPQPIYNNPGFPADNPPSNAYLPPKETEGNDTISTMNKFEVDDRPVWDMTDNDIRSTTIKPTRRPKPSGQITSTHPPLIRDEQTTSSSAATTSNSGNKQPISPNQNLPSRCVWAIISCCSASSNAISYDCFEQLGCNGAFWGDSPCESDIARAAISNVMNYYQSK